MAMRRIKPPVCTICNVRAADYESDAWPTLKICQDCRSLAVQYIYRTGITHGNTLLIELAAGLDNGDRPDAFRIWLPTPNQPSCYFEYYVKYTSESERQLENPLDLLDLIL